MPAALLNVDDLELLPLHRLDVSDSSRPLDLRAVDLQRLSVDRDVAVDAVETGKGAARDEGQYSTAKRWGGRRVHTDGASHLA